MKVYTNTKRNFHIAGFVYAIEDESARIKLGMADDVDTRLKELQTGNAERLTVKYRLQVNNMKRAEDALHNLFAAYRLRADGEWFSGFDLQLLAKIFGAVDITEREELLLKGLGLR